MKNFVNRPYPHADQQYKWRVPILIGLFVFLFLISFQPFELDRLPQPLLWRSTLAYGFIAFLIPFLSNLGFPFLFPKIYNEDNWKVLNEILHLLTVVLLVTIANYLFTVWSGFISFNLSSFIKVLLWTLPIAGIIITGIIALKTNRALKKHLLEAQRMNKEISSAGNKLQVPETLLTLASEVGKQDL